MLIPGPILSLVIGMALVLAGLWLGGNVQLLPVEASANAPIYDELFRVLFTIGAVLFLGVVGLLLFSLIRFRRQSGDHGDGLAIEGNLPLEVFWTALPAIVVLFVGLYSYDVYDRMGGMASLSHSHAGRGPQTPHNRIWGGIGGFWPGNNMSSDDIGNSDAALVANAPVTNAGSAQPIAVEVTAMQFAFIFNYPGSGIVSGELHVPAGRPVSLLMESKDVLHAFLVPEFRIKQDVIPGQPTVVSFTATRPGRYPIICAELCGPYHGGMRSTVVVDEPDVYDAWLSDNTPSTLAQAAGPSSS